MEENKSNSQPIPDILTLADKEKFRRQMVWVSKLVAIGLVLAIFYFGWVNYSYAKDVNNIMSEYGSMGYCYMCGLETFKQCSCQYLNPYGQKQDIEEIRNRTANNNIIVCKDKNLAPQTNPLDNISLITIK